MTSFTAIASALAARFAAGAMTAPTGYDAVRVSTALLPNQLPPLPCVLVLPDTGSFDTGNGTRMAASDFLVRFYYSQAGDLARDSAALLAWLGVLVDQLKAAVQLGGLVDRATVEGWTVGLMTYADQPYSGIELRVRVITSDAWAATA